MSYAIPILHSAMFAGVSFSSGGSVAIAKWAAPGARSSNIAGGVLNSLANGSESAVITYDNSTARDLYACVTILLGSFTPSAGGSVTLRVYSGDGTDAPDVGGAASDAYVVPLTTTASTKSVTIPLVRLYPFANMRFTLVNNAGVALAASGHSLFVRPYNEDVT